MYIGARDCTNGAVFFVSDIFSFPTKRAKSRKKRSSSIFPNNWYREFQFNPVTSRQMSFHETIRLVAWNNLSSINWSPRFVNERTDQFQRKIFCFHALQIWNLLPPSSSSKRSSTWRCWTGKAIIRSRRFRRIKSIRDPASLRVFILGPVR